MPGRLTEISKGGLALCAGLNLQPGDPIEVELPSPYSRVKGTVRSRDGYCFGVEFLTSLSRRPVRPAATWLYSSRGTRRTCAKVKRRSTACGKKLRPCGGRWCWRRRRCDCGCNCLSQQLFWRLFSLDIRGSAQVLKEIKWGGPSGSSVPTRLFRPTPCRFWTSMRKSGEAEADIPQRFPHRVGILA